VENCQSNTKILSEIVNELTKPPTHTSSPSNCCAIGRAHSLTIMRHNAHAIN